jgi:hypothetical protein
MREEVDLTRALKDLAETSPREAPPAGEERLRRAFRAHRRGSRWKWLLAAAVACLAIAAGWTMRQRASTPVARPVAQSNPFVPLPYGQSDVPLESGVIVRVRVESDAGPVEADLLVGQDGMARAVRFDQ